MYHGPNLQSNPHYSTTSSVYTDGGAAVESGAVQQKDPANAPYAVTDPLNPFNISTPGDLHSPHDRDGSAHGVLLDAANEVPNPSFRAKQHKKVSRRSSSNSLSSGSSSGTADSLSRKSSANSGFQQPSFNTSSANNNALSRKSSTMSFTSINNSLFRQPSVESFPNHIDHDATPKLNSAGYTEDVLDDKTPLVGEDSQSVFANHVGHLLPDPEGNTYLTPTNRATSPKLPQQELSKKFQRLSMTLQQTRTSGDSYQFMSAFQQNVEKVNSDGHYYTAANKKRLSKTNNRTSLYYKKIHDLQEEEDSRDDDEDEVGVDEDRTIKLESDAKEEEKPLTNDMINTGEISDISSLSNRSSIVSEADYEIPVRKDLAFKQHKVTRNDKEAVPYVTPSPSTINGNASNFNSISNMTSINSINSNIYDKYPNGLNITYTDSMLDPKNLPETLDSPQIIPPPGHQTTDVASRASVSTSEDDDDLSSLFIRAMHPFDSTTLQSASDASICLSFEKDDLAFVHTIDDSGWGEVTVIDSLERGWIPMNYFTMAVSEEMDFQEDEDDDDENEGEDHGKIPNSHYLKPLFHACGKFLMNPLSHKNRKAKFTFSIRVINSIRDGVRLLLQYTDCLSRSNEIVTKRPIVRKTRKSLLADWYNLMIKANEFKGTSNFNKIEILTLMIYQVTRKAVAFLQIWSIESKQIIKRENEKKLQNDMNNYPLLATPPLAKQRITEINGLLYCYLGLIIGRLDLIEHNTVGCDLLESLTHQIILLLRELLFISKTGSDFSSEKPSDLDHSLDSLLSLVSDLVSGVKNLVVKTMNETDEDRRNAIESINSSATLASPNSPAALTSQDYYYTQEGGDLILIAAKMIKSINFTILSIKKLLEVTGDFKLNSERAYPDYSKMRIDPLEFIRKCSIGIARTQDVKNRDLKVMAKATGGNSGKSSNRYSMLRSGKTGELGITPGGASMLHDVLITEEARLTSPSSEFSANAEFIPFISTQESDGAEIKDLNEELLVDSKGNLLGASFKGLVYTLTNETSPPEYFFVSTFFICFRSFSSGLDLIEELINRFDVTNRQVKANKNDVSQESRMKNRRRLIVKMFQLWMESYWKHEVDYSYLSTLLNFFNEGISMHLPMESMKLIEIAAKLSTRPLVETQALPKSLTKQLVNRSITMTRTNRKNSLSLHDNLSSRYSMVDGYELSKINTNTSTSSSLKSMALPMPLGIGNQTSSSSTLLSKNQTLTIERINLTYRAILGTSWCLQKYISAKTYMPLELSAILPNWFNICDQSWVLSNYRPNLLDFNGLEIAKQLTITESQIFCAIKIEELLNENYSPKRANLRLAVNVRQSLLFTNCLSGYVLESILQPKISIKMRINIIKTWLKVSISCLYLRNFNSLAAIITSLQSHLITRLSKLWAELSDKYKELYDYLSGIIHPEKNYNTYRLKLRNFLISNEFNIPIVPYFSLFLQDLTFINEGNPKHRKANTFLKQKLINIDKYLKITRIVADIESLQIPYESASPSAVPSSSAASISSAGTVPREKRSSLLFLSNHNQKKEDLGEFNIIPVPAFQELILLELWKVNQLNKTEDDRAWKLSCLIQPRDAQ